MGISGFKTQSFVHAGIEPATARPEAGCSPIELMQIEWIAACVFRFYLVVQDAVCGSELT